MLKKRLIPVLFLKNGLIVRSEQFVDFREFGNPIHQLQRLNDWSADELVYIDITRSGKHDLKRDDHKIARGGTTLELLRHISRHCFMPLTFGGRIFHFEQALEYIENGADKVIVNSGAHEDITLITKIADHFGSQCVVVGIDTKNIDGKYSVYYQQGTKQSKYSPIEWAKKAEDNGAGEIFLNSIDRDGMLGGYDIDIIQQITEAVSLPVIACGGAGKVEHFSEVFHQTSASAVAAGNIFNFTENAYIQSKIKLCKEGVPVRPFAFR